MCEKGIKQDESATKLREKRLKLSERETKLREKGARLREKDRNEIALRTSRCEQPCKPIYITAQIQI